MSARIDADALREAAGEAGWLAVLRSLGIDTDAGSRSGDNLGGLRLPASIGADRNPSLSVNLRDGTYNDFGSDRQGTVFQLVQEAHGETFPEALERVARITGYTDLNGPVRDEPLTLEALAEQKRLPVSLIEAEGWRQSGRFVRIAYLLADGTEARPQLRRANGGQFWGKWGTEASMPIVPLGLNRLGDAEEVALVEGATDWITLRHHGIPALGIPGASMTGKLEAEHITGVSRVYVVKEKDAGGGATFSRNATQRLREIGFEGEVLIVDMKLAGCKDPSALHVDDPGRFSIRWQALVLDAKPWNVTDDNARVDGKSPRPTHALDVRALPVWLDEASAKPRPRQLFGPLWHEGELCILFAETNVGKSIVAVQIAWALSSGASHVIEGFVVEADGQPVLYIDFELSAKQFHGRYSTDYGTPFAFDPRFLRAEVSRDFDFDGGDWSEHINAAIEAAVEETGARVLIVDNLTYLRDETERAKGALPLMRHLNALKRRHGLSILAIAHTPKRDGARPITRNDLAGSRALLDLCDSSFALGESHRDEGLRYLKQIKVRETEFSLTASRVAVVSLAKREGFLRFDLVGYEPEDDHLGRGATVASKQEDAGAWLVAYLADGPRPSDEVIEAGAAEGHSQRTLWRAKDDLGIKPRKIGFDEGWEWELPEGVDLRNQPDLPKAATPGTPPPHDGDGAPSDDMPHFALHRGLRVRTPEGEGKVLQTLADQVTVHLDGAVVVSTYLPSDIEPLEEAPF